MMRTLPPFDALVAFEAACRHRSMSLAADELRVTQSAISHRLKRLEVFVGASLLDRTRTGLTPTAAGAALRAETARLLDEMASLRARSRAAVRPATLRIGVGAALAQNWLIRRLPRFAAGHPDVAIELVDAGTEAQGRAADVDLQILWLPKAAARSTSTQRLLFEEQVFPVAAPALLPGGTTLAAPAGLAGLSLLHKGPAGRDEAAEWSWPAWFARLGLGTPPPAGLRFDTIGLTVAAALQGAGVALARSLLVHDALAERRLQRALDSGWDMASSKVHVLRWPAVLADDPRIARFTPWVAAEVDRMTGATPPPG